MVNLHVAVEVETVMWLPSHFWMQFDPVQKINACMGGLYYDKKHEIYFISIFYGAFFEGRG